MINAFRKSRIACWAVRAAALAIIAFLWYHDRNYPIYIPIVASILTIGIGYFLSKLLGNIISSTENTKALGYLHMELDPQKFIACYKDVPGKIKSGTQDRAVTSSYLADGYLSMNDPKKALETLEAGFKDVPLENKTSLQGLYHTCRSAYLIELGEYDQTARELEILRNVILSCGENRALADNLNTTLKIREAELNILKGEPVPDREWLNKLISRSTYNLRRLELYKTLADDAILRKDRTEALHRLRKMEEEGGKTRFADYAKAKRKEL